MECFTYFNDVIEYVEEAIDAFDDFSQNFDCEAIANDVSDWDERLGKYVLIKDGNDFWAVVAAHAL